jgi:cell division cycle 14
MAASTIVSFCDDIDSKLKHPKLTASGRPVIFYMGTTPEEISSGVLLLCCHLVFKEGFTPAQAVARFSRIRGIPVIPFRGISKDCTVYALSILDTVNGLLKGQVRGLWDPNAFDMESYLNLVKPNCNATVISPKIAVLACPVAHHIEGPPSALVDGAGNYAEVLRGIGVNKVVRIGGVGALQNPCELVEQGFDVEDIVDFRGENPSQDVIDTFFGVVQAASGRVAVCCRDGYGASCTLVACHLIRYHGFSAAEAIGYMRVLRPGSVYGEQHCFLEEYADSLMVMDISDDDRPSGGLVSPAERPVPLPAQC